ncbi:MAG: carboxypeptidase M32 [Lentisphaeria bacterium]|nr:carboxypeptidase M32 [Candidatus Neomarinimicrobiota bacterium]MCF7841967.1 carboxypeptidase M32 [Lentisphaeria bacterium]
MSALENVLNELKKISYLRGAEALLSWDQETYMPEGAGDARSNQIAHISTLLHNTLVGETMSKNLGELVDLGSGKIRDESLPAREQRRLKEIWRDYHHAAALPSEFVEEVSKHASRSQQLWVKARQANDFSMFQPSLEKTVEYKHREIEYLGKLDTPYDTLLDEFEPHMTSAKVTELFSEIRSRLVPLIQDITAVKDRVDNSILKKDYPIEQQWDFGMSMLKAMGFDMVYGRQDKSAHPFTTSTHPTDVRVTTRLMANDLKSALLSTLHEGGHGLYEQGLPGEEADNPFGEAISLGIHESQSRLWENLVGLSRPFWAFAYPKLQEYFPESLTNVPEDDFYKAMNKVEPSLIRVEADEATYNLHIMVRYEIEKLLINENYPVAKLPELWNDKMEEYLGIRPDKDANGVLQDVHWSFGAIGYFPTYTLGNLYSAMWFNQAQQEIRDLNGKMAQGDLLPLRDWLREKIHRHGRSKTADELVREITGEELSAKPFLDYLEKKYQGIYGL